MRKTFFVLLLFLVGCTSFSPVLKPISKSEVSASKESINLFVKPVITQGIGSEDKKQWKMDVSAYFTAFEVALVNNTSKSLVFDPEKSFLQIEEDQRFAALDQEASLQYYKREDARSSMSLIPKSKEKAANEVAIIKAAGISGGRIDPGEQRRGLLFFRKVAQDHCRNVVLNLAGITVAETGEDKRFSFAFSCDTTG